MANFSPIELQPGADLETQAQIINNNFRQVAESNRANIITDSTGTRRILLGKAPTSDIDYGLYITKPNKDVIDELSK